jgi:hypothetical protein
MNSGPKINVCLFIHDSSGTMEMQKEAKKKKTPEWSHASCCYLLVEVYFGSYFIAYVQCLSYWPTHPVVFHRKKHRVQNDAQCDEKVEQWVTHHLVQSTLEP